ncbi:MAG: PD40 domain-containing protein [Alphaproteobacteria bacterium]|nr:PD40 domain-containing protein [Alphaproteobacteria bacterium]
MSIFFSRRHMMQAGLGGAALLALPGSAQAASVSNPLKRAGAAFNNAGRIDWQKAANVPSGYGAVAYGQNIGTYYKMETATLSGSGSNFDLTSPTAVKGVGTAPGATGLGATLTKHVGNPAWSPDGKYIAFQAQIPSVPSLYNNVCEPGIGTFNDVYIVMTSSPYTVTKLTSGITYPASGDPQGVLHPHWSHSKHGSANVYTVLWAERVSDGSGPYPPQGGKWTIKARTVNTTTGALGSIVDLDPFPSTDYFYETHAFSPDDGTFYFTRGSNNSGSLDYDIYRVPTSYDASTGAISFGTPVNQIPDSWDYTKNQSGATIVGWDEHAIARQGDGAIVWMSSKGRQGTAPLGVRELAWNTSTLLVQSEFWKMNADASNWTTGGTVQLTDFNADTGSRWISSDFAWDPDPATPTRFIGRVQRYYPYALPIFHQERFYMVSGV